MDADFRSGLDHAGDQWNAFRLGGQSTLERNLGKSAAASLRGDRSPDNLICVNLRPSAVKVFIRVHSWFMCLFASIRGST